MKVTFEISELTDDKLTWEARFDDIPEQKNGRENNYARSFLCLRAGAFLIANAINGKTLFYKYLSRRLNREQQRVRDKYLETKDN